MKQELKRVVHSLVGSESTVILTGAGVSRASGIPTFRGSEGLWNRYRAEELATAEAFQRDPELVWEWYFRRLQLIEENSPNPAHRALTQLEQHLPGFWIVTQNVDGYHQQAGSEQVIELHGSIRRARCLECETRSTLTAGEGVPHCECGGVLRPDVVWFGETLPLGELQRAAEMARRCDLFMAIGTSGVVEPAASLLRLAAVAGAITVEINPERTVASHQVDIFLEEKADQVLPEIWSMCEEKCW